MKFVDYSSLSPVERNSFPPRESIRMETVYEQVRPILEAVRQNGIEAATAYGRQFDKLETESVLVSEEEYLAAENELPESTKQAMQTAYENIRLFHQSQKPDAIAVETMPGILCEQQFRAIEQVGLYIPGGSAPLPSTVLMLGIPAKIAGCSRIVACTPCKGKVHPAVLYAAKLAGVTEFLKIGGAQAIALLAYGAPGFMPVDKIFGPGNQFVMAAKQLVSIDPAGCAIDMPAGPSEVLVIAEKDADAAFVAADLLAQAEHGIDSQAVLVSDSSAFITAVQTQVDLQMKSLPRREIAQASMAGSYCVLVPDLAAAFAVSNAYAPEHLILHLKNPERYKSEIVNAGSVFLGQYSPESVGDYASGTNHSLPTSGYAKSMGGITVSSFMKSITFQQLSYEGLKAIAATVEQLADTEGLFAHKNAVTIRMKP